MVSKGTGEMIEGAWRVGLEACKWEEAEIVPKLRGSQMEPRRVLNQRGTSLDLGGSLMKLIGSLMKW